MNVVRSLVLLAAGVITFFYGPSVLSAHELHLKNGAVIKTSYIKRSGDQVTYEQFGGKISIPLSEVDSIKYDRKGARSLQRRQHEAAQEQDTNGDTQDLGARLSQTLLPKTPIEQANLAVVSIRTEAGHGSGFFISSDGLIVTNRHVVRGSEKHSREVTDTIETNEDRFRQWRRTLDEEEKRLTRSEKNLKKSWQKFNKTVAARGNSIDQDKRREVQGELKEKGQYLQQWRRDYLKRRGQYQDKYKDFRQQAKDFHRKKNLLAKQSRFPVTLADGTETSALLYRVSEKYDLALLKLNGYQTPFLQQALSGSHSLGQKVYAIGSPLQLNNSVTSGVISNYRGDYIQTNAEIYPGNSGGPLVTEDGQVLGVNTMKMITEKFEGLGFAIDFAKVRSEFDNYLVP